MELFCALLTGFFGWLLLVHWHHSELARAREAAGALLIEVHAAGSMIREARWQHWFHVGRLLTWAAMICLISLPSGKMPGVAFLVAAITYAFLETAFPPFRKDKPLELRQRGVICREQLKANCPLQLTFTPWAEITVCNWYDKVPEYHVHTKHLALESDGLLPDEIAAVTAVAGRFVCVFSSKGKLLAEPESAETNVAAPQSPTGGRLKFQFNLQSLMLLTVVVSCAASCCGIHYRRIQSQEAAVAKPAPVAAPPVKGR